MKNELLVDVTHTVHVHNTYIIILYCIAGKFGGEKVWQI